jgi:gliding motility-associated-like protein
MNTEGKTQTLKIKNVSVINEQGHVRISWEYNGTDDLEIFRDNITDANLSPLLIRNSTETSYIDSTAQAHLKPRLYKIQSTVNANLRSEVVSTYHLTFKYDSCLQQIQLNWKDLVVDVPLNDPLINDWIPSQFTVNINEDGILRTETVDDASKEEYAINGILENTNYSIFLETQWEGQTETSYSNPIVKFTEMPQSPDYINSVSASVDGNNTNLKFEIASNSELNTYKLLKFDSYSGIYDTIETLITTDTEILTTDPNSEPYTKISYYKLVSVNECGNETTNSDIINNIVLEIETNEFENTLGWNGFKESSLIPVNYDIYRIVSNQNPELIGSFSNFNSFQDNIESLQSYSQFCYYVQANAEGSADSDYSQSNTACMYLTPKVYIPEAFTPNDDGTNDLFKPVFTFIPKKYELRVYNRWGNAIFETGDYSKPWDGREPNGNSAPTGAYIYYLRIKSPNDQIIEQRGSIMVIYP